MSVVGVESSLRRTLISQTRSAGRPILERAAAQAADQTSTILTHAKPTEGVIARAMGKMVESGTKLVIWAGKKWPTFDRLVSRLYGMATRRVDEPLGNLGQIGPKLIRGAQPTEEGFAELAERGVKTVINLRPENNLEADAVKKLGMKAIYIPEHGLDAPTHAQTLRFLEAALDPANGKVYFHCYHGSDRTGTMAAAIRIARDGWTSDRAIQELGKYGFHEHSQQAKLAYIREFETYWKSLPTAHMARILHTQDISFRLTA